MKKSLLFIALLLLSLHGIAQKTSDFPFRGGKEAMMSFFKDSLVVSPEIKQKKVTGMVVFKFTSDDSGKVSKMVVYYADDLLLVGPVVQVLKKSSRNWLNPGHEAFNDYIIIFNYGFNPPPASTDEMQKAVYDNYITRTPIVTANQIPLNMTTLLPAVSISYDLPDY